MSDKDSLKTTSTKSSRKSRKDTRSQGVESDDISLSQLEMMANKKKLIKKDTETKESIRSEAHPQQQEPRRASSSSSMSTSSDMYRRERAPTSRRTNQRENNNDYIRKEKCEYLYKLDKLTAKNKGRALNLDMNNSLDEIRNEYERISNEMKTERSVAFFKRMLLLGVQGIEMLNTRFDPMGVDLDGWSEAMGYSLENQEYDEVLAELYEKYKGAGQMSPEVKLIFMIISSATMFTISKKITKLDSSNAFKNIIGSFMGGQQNSQPQNQAHNYQQNYQQQQNYNYHEPTETSEDPMPSKLRGPMNEDNPELTNILRTMNARKLEKDKELEKLIATDTSDDVFKSIPTPQKKRRGRPPKVAVR